MEAAKEVEALLGEMASKTYIYRDLVTGAEMFNVAHPHVSTVITWGQQYSMIFNEYYSSQEDMSQSQFITKKSTNSSQKHGVNYELCSSNDVCFHLLMPV